MGQGQPCPDGGGFRHDEKDSGGGPYLGDTLAMGRGSSLPVYAATGERRWLEHGEKTARVHERALPPRRRCRSRHRRRDRGSRSPNTAARRERHGRADREPARSTSPATPPTGALADEALALPGASGSRAPASTPAASCSRTGSARAIPCTSPSWAAVPIRSRAALLDTALREPAGYKRVELWDPAEGPLPHADVSFPPRARPAAYLCTAGRCSAPADTAEALRLRLRRAG